MKHILTIVADENDADYLTEQKEVDLSEIIHFPVLENFEGNVIRAEATMLEFLQTFAKVLTEKPRGNWTRVEFDDIKEGAGITIRSMIIKLYGISVSELDSEHFTDTTESDAAIEQWFDFLGNYLPYGEFGVHTIESISYVPVDSETLIYKRERK